MKLGLGANCSMGFEVRSDSSPAPWSTTLAALALVLQRPSVAESTAICSEMVHGVTEEQTKCDGHGDYELQ